MVMTIAKITADGYAYLTRHVAHGDAGVTGDRDAAAYYAAQGNPPGVWTGRGAPMLGLAGREVTEEQMRALFGLGEHPDSDAIIAAYLREHVRADMTGPQLDKVRDAAIAAARLGRAFPAYQPLEKFDARVNARLAVIRQETGREPTGAEEKKISAAEARRQRAAVAGFDLVFSPVKSAALLWAIDDRPWVRDAIREAHQAAMREALDLVEEHAAFTRTGTGGIAQVETNGLTAAAFEHWDSRAGDPNLHTHVAVSAKVQGKDGKWRALDARCLYRMTVAVSEAYNTGFEAHLSARLGVTFTARPDTVGGREPVREITGVPLSAIEFFSRRRAAIEARYATLLREYRDAHGHDPDPKASYQLARQANLDTRQGKQPPRALAGRRAAWREELTAAFGPGALAQVTSTVPGRRTAEASEGVPSAVVLEELSERVVANVAARRSTWTVWHLRAETERQIRARLPGLPPEHHREVADAVTTLAASPTRSICVEAPSLLDEPAELRRSDGASVFTEHAAARYSSQEVLDAEARLVNATRTPTTCGLAGPSTAAALDGFEAVTRTSLDPGQRELVTAFACDTRLLLAGIGPAGSGKTTAMRALAHVVRAAGKRLVPLATSAASADVLGRELGVRAENLHKFLHEHTAGPFAARLRAGAGVPDCARMFRLNPGDVVLVDEAGMAGTFMLDRLVQLASARGAVVRLLGDDRQLPAVEGGGALRLVAAQPGTPQLTELYRFRDPAEGAATLLVRAGDPAAVDWYHANGRIRSGSRESMAAAAYNGWKNDMLAGKITLMAAADAADVTELSAQARTNRVAAGQVEASGVQLRDGNLAGQGDWIVTRDNQRRLDVFGGRDWVKNGDSWQVTRRFDDGSLAVRHLRHGGHVTLPAWYVRDRVQLLYATTAHRAEGATVDTAHPLITAGMTREALYVLASRAREKTTLYVATHDHPFDDDARVDQVRRDARQYAGREVLLNVLATEGAPLPATETITTAQEEAASLTTLVPRYLHAAGQDADSRYRLAAVTALGDNGGRSLVADPAWGAVVRRLFDAEGDGWDPARLIATVSARRELASADSLAEVIAWRIDAFLADNPEPPTADDTAPVSCTRQGASVPPASQPSDCQAYETGPEARQRLTALAVAILGSQVAGRAQSEVAWPALIAALRRAETAGFDATDALSRTATARELRSAQSISETLAWRINRHLAADAAGAGTAAVRLGDDTERAAADDHIASAANREHGEKAAAAGILAVPLLPWVPGPRQVPVDSQAAPMAVYLNGAADMIAGRVQALADIAVRFRPPWITALGQQPDAPRPAGEWHRHVAVVAAYRDQHRITTDDPRQVLGPYVESGRAGHKAYRHAAESVLAASRLAASHASGDTADIQASTQVAVDVYRTLSVDERAAVAALVGAASGPAWLSGAPFELDENEAVLPVHAAPLATVLADRGHLTPRSDFASWCGTEPGRETSIHEAAKRSRPPRAPAGPSGGGGEPGAHPCAVNRLREPWQHQMPADGPTPRR